MNHPTTKTVAILTETIAVRLTLDECRALVALCRQQDRTISWVVRTQLRRFLQTQQGA
jgi:hypothetical protein